MELDVRTGRWSEGDQRYTASDEEALYYAAMHALRRRLLEPRDFADVAQNLLHVGSDAVVEVDGDGRITRQRPLEAIETSLSEDVTLHVAFEVESHLPARMLITDGPADLEVEIVLDEYREASGVVWPHCVSVRSAALSFEERYSDLVVEW